MDETTKMESQLGVDETAKMENHLSSVAAFVEGGIQEACDDACSICLEAFYESDPSTVTGCKHEFHLQCILEWCQRSSQCPMCWQPISFKDPTSQELLEGVERERSLRVTKPRNTAIFHHPTLGDFELQHLPVGANDADLEERIFQHLAAAAAMGRAHLARREGRRGRSGAHGRPQYLIFSADTDTIPAGPVAASSTQRESEDAYVPLGVTASSSAPLTAVGGDLSSSVPRPISIQSSEIPISTPRANNSPTYNQVLSDSRSSSIQSIQSNQERAGPSEFQSFSESFKSRLSAVSMKYKDSITKTTRGWRERFFSRNSATTDANSQNRTDGTPIVTTISHMIEHLHARDGNGTDNASRPHSLEGHLESEAANESLNERHTEGENIQKDNTPAPYTAASGSS